MSDPRRDSLPPAASTDAGALSGASSQVPVPPRPPAAPPPFPGDGAADGWGGVRPTPEAGVHQDRPADAGPIPGAGDGYQAHPGTGASPGAADGTSSAPPDIGWMGDLKGLTGSLRGMVQGRLLLLSLELQRAQQGLMSLVVLLVVAAIAGATAWLALWAGLAALAVQLGLSWPWACAAVLGANLLLLLWMVAAMKSLMPLLSLPASRRQFHWLFNDPQDAPAPPDDGRTATTP
ncbi:hypothetical protein [Roseateles amylovorans]|jgi:hypothetical protein|uniref:Phage holin family protein n=1 Tax=Roseateles amylovorans TaxID=2978473 RepID=A0ABY6B7U7_9BURK|nr:hypothetical protein [Roseateles amylovorans]UXH80535.1 hypothetical protein N4261_11955 [Roseateles amylovorans]